MTRRKKPPEVSLVRSSAAEYLTFVAATGSQQQAVEMRYEDENIWLSQKMMASLYDVTVPAISQHLKRIFTDRELIEEAVVKQYLTTAADGKTYNVKHYNLQAIIAVGFKNRERARGSVPQVGHAGGQRRYRENIASQATRAAGSAPRCSPTRRRGS